MPNFTTFLWFDGQAEEAAQFYASIFPDAKIGNISRHPKGSRMPEGLAMFVELEMLGQKFVAVNGFSDEKHNGGVHFIIDCETQDQVDYYWNRLLEGGGEPGECGWLTDRFGLTWEVTPNFVRGLLTTGTPEQTLRVMQAMRMTKLDGPALQRAFDGT